MRYVADVPVPRSPRQSAVQHKEESQGPTHSIRYPLSHHTRVCKSRQPIFATFASSLLSILHMIVFLYFRDRFSPIPSPPSPTFHSLENTSKPALSSPPPSLSPPSTIEVSWRPISAAAPYPPSSSAAASTSAATAVWSPDRSPPSWSELRKTFRDYGVDEVVHVVSCLR